MPVSQDDPRLQRCGFAKLLGDNFEFYIRKYETAVGRKSKSANLDVVLGGDNMNISRKHAAINYNFEKGHFELEVLGKNGVTIQGVLHTPGSGPIPLNSQDLIQLGDRSFHFLLPRDITKRNTRPAKRQRVVASREVSRGDANTAVYEPYSRPGSTAYHRAYPHPDNLAAPRDGRRNDVEYDLDSTYQREAAQQDDQYRPGDDQQEPQYKQSDDYQYSGGSDDYPKHRYEAEEGYTYNRNRDGPKPETRPQEYYMSKDTQKTGRYKSEDGYQYRRSDSYDEDGYNQAHDTGYGAQGYPRAYPGSRSPPGSNGQYYYSNDNGRE